MTVSNSSVDNQGSDSAASSTGQLTPLPESFYKGSTCADALKALTDRTGYTLVQNNGQRRYGGPPPNWSGPAPHKGCEVFIGKIPRDLYEDVLVPVLERAGRIYELRLMMDFSHHNRGYAFCMYTKKSEAQMAVKLLNNYEIRPGRMIGVCISIDNCRLFVGGIPKHKSRQELLEEMSQITEGVHDCIMYPSAADKTKNRGFAFIEYESHRAAAMARRKLIPGKIPLWGQQIAVDWAEPEAQVDDDVMKSVKILYVRGLMLTTKEETIERLFGQYAQNCVERVKKIKDFAFVHYHTREDAEVAKEKLDGTSIDGVQIEVTFAKPVDKDQIRYTKNNNKSMPPLPIAPSFFDQQSLGQSGGMGDPSTAAAAAAVAAAAYRQGNMPFMPSPTGPLAVGSFGMMGKGMRGAAGGGFKSQYGKMFAQQQQMQQLQAAMQQQQPRMGGYQPQMMLSPGANLLTPPAMQPASYSKRSNEILEEVCSRNGWGAPVYQIVQRPDPQTGAIQFAYRVTIFISKGPDGQDQKVFYSQSPKFCATLEEAKMSACENTLLNLLAGNPGNYNKENVGSPYSSGGGGGGGSLTMQSPKNPMMPSSMMNDGNAAAYHNAAVAAAYAASVFPNSAAAMFGSPQVHMNPPPPPQPTAAAPKF